MYRRPLDRLALFFTLTLLGFSLSFILLNSSEVEATTPLIERTLKPGESSSFELDVNTGSTPVSKLDVAFVFDVTSSMDWVEDVSKEKAEEIKTSIKEMVDDTAFAVAWFADYSGEYRYPDYVDTYGDPEDRPWNMIQDITTDLVLVGDAINSLPYLYGGDWPESYTRALYETEFLSWRGGAKKVVILFGDAPLHDLDFYSPESFGGDPGRDGVAMTNDDLDFETVVEELKDVGIVVMGIYCKPDIDPSYVETAKKSFEYMADETEGQVMEIDAAEEIPDAIASLVESEVEKIKALTLTIPTKYSDFVTWTPHTFEDVGPETTVTFDVTISIPLDVGEVDELAFSIDATGDGATIGTIDVVLDISSLLLSSISCSISSYEVEEGEWIRVSGEISPPNEGQIVSLKYIKPDGSELTRTATTAWDGTYANDYTPDTLGSWSVTASWLGDEEHEGATSSSTAFIVEEFISVDERTKLAQLVATTVLATVGGFGATLISNRIGQVSGEEVSLEVGEVIEDIETRKRVKVSIFRQLMILFLGIALLGSMYALATAAIISELFVFKLPFEVPLIGQIIPIEYISDFDFILFLDMMPVILFCSGLVFIWRFILGMVTSKIIGVKTALVGNKIGAITLFGTTFLNMPIGFPLAFINESHTTQEDRGYMAFAKNFGLLILLLPFYIIWEYSLAGWNSAVMGYAGILITLMTFFYTMIPYDGEGRELFNWNKSLDIPLIIMGLVLFFGFQLSKLPWDAYLATGLVSLLSTAVALIIISRKTRTREKHPNISSPPLADNRSRARNGDRFLMRRAR